VALTALCLSNVWSQIWYEPKIQTPEASPQPTAAVPALQDTTLAELPQRGGPNFVWVTARGLSVQRLNQVIVVSGQPVLRLIATPSDTGHSLVARYRGLDPNQTYRIMVWAKPDANGGNVEVAALDRPDGTSLNNGYVIFDPAAKTVLDESGVKGRGIEQTPNGWEHLWIDLPTSDGEFSIAVRVASGNSNTFKGDDRLGFTFGGIDVEAGD
jgi:hypothetical protein